MVCSEAVDWLNYHHLLYFYTVAREGGVARASEQLRLAQPTISGQVRALESALGERLFQRSGRRLVLTDAGRLAYRYAEEIFSLGREMRDALRGRPTGRPLRFLVGVADALPKLVARRLLRPALQRAAPLRLVCREGKPEQLLALLAVHELDLVLADAPAPPDVKVRAFHHLLGESGVTFFAPEKLAGRLRRGFPRSLDGAAAFLPAENTALRHSLDQWLESHDLRPEIAGEFEDSALMKSFAQGSTVVFPAPTAIEREVQRQFGVRVVGRVPQVKERFYAISAERRLKHPAVVAISEAARRQLAP